MRFYCTVHFSLVCLEVSDEVAIFPSFTNDILLPLITVSNHRTSEMY